MWKQPCKGVASTCNLADTDRCISITFRGHLHHKSDRMSLSAFVGLTYATAWQFTPNQAQHCALHILQDHP